MRECFCCSSEEVNTSGEAVRGFFCCSREEVNTSGEAVRGLEKSRVETRGFAARE